ncbi:MAG: cysteine desulfurase, partial [Candidatus Dormibacteraeota bacterium]|nr:cysteine desulfurase [Candidatus Dormibacteraeota bacterium]
MPPSRQPAPAVFSPRRIYLDDAGGAALLAEARAARLAVPEGNPASPHAEGRA